MKVAYLLGSLNRGGTETLMLDVCNNLKKDDFDAIGIYRKDGILKNDFLNSGIEFCKLSVDRNIISYLWKLRKLILKSKVNIVHAQQPIDALFAKFACIGTHKKIILTLHGFDSKKQNKKDKLLNFILNITDENIYVSNYQKKYYTTKYKLNVKGQTVVYNGISFEKLFAKTLENNIRNELKIPADVLLLGMIGNFNEVRDQFTVVKFLKLLHQNNINFHFVFVGKRIDSLPERFDSCVDFCKKNNFLDKVSFLGVRNDVPQILSCLDAFIYSTEFDTFGIAVVEAMAMSVPVLVNDWEVMNEITEAGELATLYKSADESDLLEKFMVYLHHKEVYKQNALKSSNLIQSKYNISVHIKNLKEVYTKIYNR